jgi:uncharacterized protein
MTRVEKFSDSIDKKMRIGDLYEVYRELLTEKQRDILELYINEDLSLGEIAETFGVSRQAVHDLLKRTETILEEYESKLLLYARLSSEGERMRTAIEKLDSLIGSGASIDADVLKELVDIRSMLVAAGDGEA